MKLAFFLGALVFAAADLVIAAVPGSGGPGHVLFFALSAAVNAFGAGLIAGGHLTDRLT